MTQMRYLLAQATRTMEALMKKGYKGKNFYVVDSGNIYPVWLLYAILKEYIYLSVESHKTDNGEECWSESFGFTDDSKITYFFHHGFVLKYRNKRITFDKTHEIILK